MASLPGATLYVLLGAGSALENIVPAVPADTFVALGGLLAELGMASPLGVFFATWTCNVSSALAMYGLAHRHGRGLVDTRVGRLALRPHQLERMERFYGRFGLPAIFFTRFLPGLRAVVPVFAGITRQRFWVVAIPVAAASAIWHAVLVAVGMFAGRNLDLLDRLLARIQGVLGLLAGLLVLLIGIWWWRSRHAPRD